MINNLDCGHSPTPTSFGTGYGTSPDNKRKCYNCCNVDELKAFREAGHYMAYLSTDGTSITTWTGGLLGKVTGFTDTKAGFGSSRRYLDVRGLDGTLYYGNTPGPGMFARLHRKKNQT